MDELDKALAKIDELEQALAKESPSILHQGARMGISNIAGFIMQKLAEVAYDHFVINRKAK